MIKADIAFLGDLNINTAAYEGKSIAVHIHVFYLDLLPEFKEYLSNIPVPFDLYLSIPEMIQSNDDEIIENFSALDTVKSVVIKHTENKGRDIAPMVCSFGKEIMSHDFLLHFHTKKSPHDDSHTGWRYYLLQHILGSKEIAEKILTQLATTTGIVSAPDFIFNTSRDKWSSPNNLTEAQKVIDRSSLKINLSEKYPEIDFPQGTFFWARTDCLAPLFEIGLDYKDFPAEPIPTDGTIAHGVERLFFVWGDSTGFKPLKVFLNQSEYEFNRHARSVFFDILEERRQVQIWQDKVLENNKAYERIITDLNQYLDQARKKNEKHMKQLRMTIIIAVVLLISLIISLFL